jgi:hypothetical protein
MVIVEFELSVKLQSIMTNILFPIHPPNIPPVIKWQMDVYNLLD